MSCNPPQGQLALTLLTETLPKHLRTLWTITSNKFCKFFDLAKPIPLEESYAPSKVLISTKGKGKEPLFAASHALTTAIKASSADGYSKVKSPSESDSTAAMEMSTPSCGI
ncbi:hypothetical protein PILCRDRAFT_9559 [Piloderma croceum F 1598]|uniref:Uncharacterized protein n=1 Tax=Piloderma croceum (strain F 1598) TaxID=765440 RepID=A0A0C3F6Q8_PILCF|nr:hypothetical protein PILCRDRAFT_9559 [Piloderma croceum F 1598]